MEHNSSPDTVISNNTSNTVTPIQQQNCPSSKQDYPVYSDNFYPVGSAQQQQYPHYNWNSSYPHNLYNSATNLQHYPPAYSHPQAYYRNHPQQRPPHIPYPEGNQSMMHRSASFAAFPTQ
uniref:Uncharacterized protein n=1 Tax=Panagrolaimus davidi TaxID=227884 RepID=A0A914PFB0_9BILA